MDSGPSIIINLVVIIVILALAVLFTLTEYSLVKVRPSALKALKEEQKSHQQRSIMRFTWLII
ncbi:Uncharacterised protein [Weissella viridescens]|uniref:Mg2+ and Co2+ transporter CorB n=1 Tax=Weissella viridescens TaxID=1629 RepID=A0A380P8U0_WEIVI|nr:Uncharacterised protein [Weissella viridescens]